MDATLHKAFDFYDLLAITISLDYGKDIIAFLEADLSYRQEVMNATGQLQPRNFQVSQILLLLLINVPNVSLVFPQA